MANETNMRGGAATVRRAAPDILHARFDAMMRHADGTREGSDPEALHDMRVASRRLRAALDAFAPAYGGGKFRRAMRETKTLTRALGAVRDDDVLLGAMRRYAEGVPEDEAPAVARFIERLEAERGRHREGLLRDLDALDESGYPSRFREAVAEPEKRGPARESGADAGQRIVAAQTAAFYALAPHIENPDAVEELHEMRIAAKRLRYALELFAEPLGPDTGAALASVRAFQEIVGEIHDADVRADLLRDYLRSRILEQADEIAALSATAEGPDAAKEQALSATAEWAAEQTALVAAIARSLATRRERYAHLRDRWQQWEAEGLREQLAALTRRESVAKAA